MLYIYSEHFRLYRYPRTTRKNCPNLGMARRFLILSVKGWVWSSRTSGERASLTDFLSRELFDNSAVNSWSCCNKLPRTGWLSNNRSLFWVSLGWNHDLALHTRQERFYPCFFQYVMVAGIPWLVATALHSASEVTLLPGACMCVCTRECMPNLSLLPSGIHVVPVRPFQVAPAIKNHPANAWNVREVGSIPGSVRSPAEGNRNSLQYSCLENPMDRGAWWVRVHRITKSWTRLKWLSTQHMGWFRIIFSSQNLYFSHICKITFAT